MDTSDSSISNIIIVEENTIFKKNVEIDNNELIGNVLSINSGVSIGGDLNTNNINSFGLISSYNNIYSEGNVFISNKETDKYVYLSNEGEITCNNIVMTNGISITNNINESRLY